MSVLAYIVAGEEDEMVAIGEAAQPLVEWSGAQVRGLDTAKAVMLHCLLTGDEFDLAVAHYEPVYVAEREERETVLLRIADEAMEKLSVLDEDALAEVAEELAATEEFEMDGWDVEQVYDLLLEFANLARLAESQGQLLFVWMQREME